MAFLACTINNLVGQIYAKKGTQPPKMKTIDFMPKWDEGAEVEDVQKQSIDEIKNFMMGFAKRQNKAVRKLHQNPPKNKRSEK